MNGFDQKIDQIVRQRPSAQMHESCEPREPGGFRTAAELIGRLDCDAPPIALEFIGEALRRTNREADRSRATRSNLVQLVLNAVLSSASPDRCQPQQQLSLPLPGTDQKAARLDSFAAGRNSASSRSRVSPA